jgi:hypothetical protein
MEEILYEQDKLMHIRQDHNNRGELVFDLHPAKLLLGEDVKSGENKQITPSDFQATRPEYLLFKPAKFKAFYLSRGQAQEVLTCTTSNLSRCKKKEAWSAH